MTDTDQVSGYELLFLLAQKHRWKVSLFTDLDLVTPGQRRDLERRRQAHAQLAVLEVVYSGEKYIRRALGPGDDDLNTAAFDVLNSLRLLGVLTLRGPG